MGAGVTAVLLATLIACPFDCPRGGGSPYGASAIDSISRVIHISVDGLRGDAVGRMGAAVVPNFHRMRVAGVYTDNARADHDFTNTLPNHTCQLTGRHVNGADGHNVDFNSDNGGTIEDAHGAYVAGVFDVVHDHGLRTGMYAGKSKFAFLERSWNAANGAPDTVGDDDGRDKIDIYVYASSSDALIDSFLAHVGATPQDYSFIHLADPDPVGHASGWCSGAYFDAVVAMDGLLGRIFSFLESDTAYRGKTAIILTADHGGTGTDHADATDPCNYTVPFFVWGPGIPAGSDCYWITGASRLDPDGERPPPGAQPQPIRNGDAANLALHLLGLPPVPGSVINVDQDLAVHPQPGRGELPEVAITNPLPESAFEPLEPIEIDATAEVAGGFITAVEFYIDWVKLGEDDTPPFSFTWNETPLGRHRIIARASTNDSLAAAASVDVTIAGTAAVDGSARERPVPAAIVPNPFDRFARVEFNCAYGAHMEMEIYDVRGRRMGTLFRRWCGEGRHGELIDAGRFAPGVYLYRLKALDGGPARSVTISTGKLMILR